MANPGPNNTTTPLLDQDGMEFAPSGGLASGDGKQVGKSPASLVGAWGQLPVAQPMSQVVGPLPGNTHTPTAGAVTGVFVNTTFDGAFLPTGNTTSGSNLLTALSSVTGLFVGMQIAGAGIPVGSVIGAISGATVSMVTPSGAPSLATATAVGITITFGGSKAYTIGDLVSALKLAGLIAF